MTWHECGRWLRGEEECDCDNPSLRRQRERQAITDALQLLESVRVDALKVWAIISEAARCLDVVRDYTNRGEVSKIRDELAKVGEQISFLRGRLVRLNKLTEASQGEA